jgi:hypothetical protein
LLLMSLLRRTCQCLHEFGSARHAPYSCSDAGSSTGRRFAHLSREKQRPWAVAGLWRQPSAQRQSKSRLPEKRARGSSWENTKYLAST